MMDVEWDYVQGSYYGLPPNSYANSGTLKSTGAQVLVINEYWRANLLGLFAAAGYGPTEEFMRNDPLGDGGLPVYNWNTNPAPPNVLSVMSTGDWFGEVPLNLAAHGPLKQNSNVSPTEMRKRANSFWKNLPGVVIIQ